MDAVKDSTDAAVVVAKRPPQSFAARSFGSPPILDFGFLILD
jgi:hypothetical protein